jgi:sulfoxide reductase heme-binding subunit YedZ
MASFLLLVPLAATSTNGMIKRLGGKRWAKLHKLTYVAAAGGVIHFYMGVKADTTIPILFAVALAVLLGYRWVRGRMDASPDGATLGIQTPPR